MKNLKGIIVPLVTPMDDIGRSIDQEALITLVRFLIEKGVHALFVSGTTGEGPLLSSQEKREMFRVIQKENQGRIPLVAHAGGLTTRETIETAENAQEFGFDAAAVFPPYYFSYENKDLFQYFSEISQALRPFPFLLYNIPSTTGHSLNFDLVKRLQDSCDNLRGIKDSSGNLYHIARVLTLQNEDFSVFIGSDFLSLPFLLMGGKGMVSGPANVFPEIFVSYYEAVAKGDHEKASKLYPSIAQVSLLFENGERLCLFKTALSMRNIPVGRVRPPLPVLEGQEDKEFREKMSVMIQELT